MSGLVDMEKLTEEQRFHELVKEQLQENSSSQERNNQDSDPHKKKEEMMARSFVSEELFVSIMLSLVIFSISSASI